MTAGPAPENEEGQQTGGSVDAAGGGDVAPRGQAARNLWLALLRTALVALLPATGLALVSLDGNRWLAAALLLVALAAVRLWAVPGVAGRIAGGSSVAIRLVAAAAATAMFSGRDDWWLAALAGVVAGLAILAEPPLTRLAAVFVPFVSNVPGIGPAPPRLGRGRLGLLLNVSFLGIGVLAGVFALPSWVWLLSAVASTVFPALTLLRTLQRLLGGRRIRRSMRAAVLAYAPEFVVYTSRPDEASYQVLMWLPYLRRTGRRFLIVARTNLAAAAIAEGTDDPVLTCRRISDLDQIITPSLRAAFYVNASSGNGAFVRYRQLTHVYLGHGDSDKAPSYNPTHAMYDRIFAAGSAAVARYAAHGVAITPEKFEVVGRPQVEAVERVETPDHPPRTVLYAPTWRGHVTETMLYSLPVAERIVRALLDRGLTVIFRAHPFSYDFPDDAAVIERVNALLRADAAASGRQHLFGPAAETERSIIDCINLSDVMVSDVSSVVSDYLFSEKPFAMVAVPCPAAEFVAEYPIARAAYIVDGDLANLQLVLDDLLGPDPRRGDRRRTRVEYLGDFPADGYADRFVAACCRAVDEAAPSAEEQVDETVDEGVAAVPLFERLRAQFVVYARDLCLAAVALVAWVAADAGARQWAAGLALVLLAGVALVSRRGVRDRPTLDRLVGTVVSARVLAAVALLSAFGGQRSVWGVAAAVTLVVLTVAEIPLRSSWTSPGTGVANLPGCADPPLPRLPVGVSYVADLLAIAVGWVALLLGAPGWVPLTFAIVAVLPFVATAVLGWRRLQDLEETRERLPEALASYGPRFAVYFGSSMGADYQVGMWLPYFDRIGVPYVLIPRTMPMLRVLADMTTTPVVQRPTLRSLEDVTVPGLTTAFYVNNAVRNTHFIERRELTHVWLNHGDSEKPACYNPVHAIYDRLFVAGQAGIDRYARHGVHIPLQKFEIVGRPQVEQITSARGPIASLADVSVLYAPTWKGPYADTNVYSLPQGRQIVQALLDAGARVIFRAHPFNQNYPESRAAMKAVIDVLADDARRTGRDHIFGDRAQRELSVEDCFNASDAMISDVSAVVSDYLKSDKPFSIVSVGRTPEQLVREAPAATAAYILREDLSNLDEVLRDLLQDDPLAAARQRTKVYYLGDFDEEHYADGFLLAARRVIGVAPTPAPRPTPHEVARS